MTSVPSLLCPPTAKRLLPTRGGGVFGGQAWLVDYGKGKLIFQVLNIKYLEDKLIKTRSDMLKKLMERRREDVRDQVWKSYPAILT